MSWRRNLITIGETMTDELEKRSLKDRLNDISFWLGLEEEDSETIIEAITELTDQAATIQALSTKVREQEWQKIEKHPKDTLVFIAIKNSCGKHRTIKAMYFSRYKHEGDSDFSEYCEEKDEYFAPEGWYEDVYSETGMDCGYIFISESPTHFMPHPTPPKPIQDKNDNNN